MLPKMMWKSVPIASILVALLTVWFGYVHFLRDRPGESQAQSTTLTGHRFPVQSLEFRPDGATLTTAAFYVATAEVEVTEWDVRTAKPTAQHSAPRSARRCLSFAHGGRTLAAGEQECGVWLWNVASPHQRRLYEHHSPIGAVACSRDGSQLAAADFE